MGEGLYVIRLRRVIAEMTAVDIIRMIVAYIVILRLQGYRIYTQVEGEEAGDLTLRAEGRVGVKTGCGIVLTVLSPGVRQFGFADGVRGTVFCDDADLIDHLATCLRINLIFYRIYFGYRIFNRHTVPYKALIDMQDTLLDDMALRRLGDLVVDDTVTFIGSVLFVHRVAEYKTHRVVNRVEITLAVDHRVFVFAYRDTFYAFRSGIDCQVQAVDAVRVVHGLECVLILLGLADSMLQSLVAPDERQLGLADCRIQFEQVGFQNHENQLFFVRTAAFR